MAVMSDTGKGLVRKSVVVYDDFSDPNGGKEVVIEKPKSRKVKVKGVRRNG